MKDPGNEVVIVSLLTSDKNFNVANCLPRKVNKLSWQNYFSVFFSSSNSWYHLVFLVVKLYSCTNALSACLGRL